MTARTILETEPAYAAVDRSPADGCGGKRVMRCVNCGNEIPGKMRFCPVCGTPADAKAPYEDSYDDGYGERYDPGYDDRMESDGIHVCGNCGSPLEYGDAFCCVCGTPVHWDDSGEGTDVNPGSAEPEKWRPAEDDEPTSVIEHGKEYPGMEIMPDPDYDDAGEDGTYSFADRGYEREPAWDDDRSVVRYEREPDRYEARRADRYERGRRYDAEAERIPAAGDFAPARTPAVDPRVSAEPAKLKGALAGGHISSASAADVDDGEFFSAPGDFE